MLIRLMIGILLAALLGGCLTTTHEHFDAKESVQVPLKGGIYECKANMSLMPDREERPPPSVFTSSPDLSLFFETLEIRQIVGKAQYALIGRQTTKVVAFHRVVDDIYVIAGDGSKPDRYGHWFFRITEGAMSPLWHVKPEELGALGKRLGVLVFEEGPGPATIQGTKADERAFIEAFVKLPGIQAMSTCTFTRE